jgi:hypothetical protein
MVTGEEFNSANYTCYQIKQSLNGLDIPLSDQVDFLSKISECSGNLKSLFIYVLEAKDGISFDEILSHPFLANPFKKTIDYPYLKQKQLKTSG